MDIAPLGFGIDTSGLVRGKQAAQDFVNTAAKVAPAVAAATDATSRASRETTGMAAAVTRATTAQQTFTREELRAAQAIGDAARAADVLTRKTKESSEATKTAAQRAKELREAMGPAAAGMAAMAREAGNMATAFGVGHVAGGGAAGMALNAGLGSATRLTREFGGALSPATKIIGGTAAAVVGLGVAYGTLVTATAAAQDKMMSYTQRLNVAFGDMGVAKSALREIITLANETGVAVDPALESFNRFARIKDDIGGTREELIQMTETIMKLGIASGVDQGSMQGAMMQLSQALAAGRLNGDELRSIMENMQPLAKAIADGLGVSVGNLKKMGAEGELTSDKIFKALLSQTEKANKEFAAMPDTVERAKTRMANQFTELGAIIGEKLGASETVQKLINAVEYAARKTKELLQDDTTGQQLAEVRAQMEAIIRIQQFGGAAAGQQRANELKEEYLRLLEREKVLVAQMEAGSTKDAAAAAEAERAKTAKAIADAAKQASENWDKDGVKLKGLNEELTTYKDRLADAKTRFKELSDEAAKSAARQAILLGQLARLDALIKNPGNNPEWVRQQVSDAQNKVRAALKAMEGQDLPGQVKTAREEVAKLEKGVKGASDAIDKIGQGADNKTGFQRLTKDIEDLRETLAKTGRGGGFTDIFREATAMARESKTAIDKVIEALITKRRLEGQLELRGMEAQIGQQQTLAQRLLGAGDDIERVRIEAAAEAATWAFERFGDRVDENDALVKSYTDTLIRLKLAQQDVADSAQMMELAKAAAARSAGLDAARRFGVGSYEQERAEFMARQGVATSAAAPSATAQFSGQSVAFRNPLGSGALTSGFGRRRGGFHNGVDLDGRIGDPVMAPAPGRVLEVDTRGRGASGKYVRILHPDGKVSGYAHLDSIDVVEGQELDWGARIGAVGNTGRVRSRGGDGSHLHWTVKDADGNPIDPMTARWTGGAAPAGGRAPGSMRADLNEAQLNDFDAERMAQAEQRLLEIRTSTANLARQAAAVGNPNRMRELELELEIERAKASAPPQQRDALERAMRDEDLQRRVLAVKETTAQQREQIGQMREQQRLFGLTSEELRIHTVLMAKKKELQAAGFVAADKEWQEAMATTEALLREEMAFERRRAQVEDMKATWRGFARDVGDAISSEFSNAFKNGEVSGRMMMQGLENAFLAMLDRIVEQLIVSPLVNLLTQLGTSLIGSMFAGGGMGVGAGAGIGGAGAGAAGAGGVLAGFAGSRGLVFGPHGITTHAMGDVFGVPTRFSHAGGVGMLGEAGEEAIMPLKRGGDGRLGVAAHGGGASNVQIQIIDQRSTKGSEAVEVQERQGGNGMRQIKVLIRDSHKESLRRGDYDADMEAQFGVSRRVAKR